MLDGLVLGAFALNEFVLIKSLNGSDFQIALLVQSSVIVLTFSIFLNEFLLRTLNKKRLIRRLAVITRIPMLAIFFFPNRYAEVNYIHSTIFLMIFLLYYLANPIILPAINQLLKNSYTNNNFGKLYSLSSVVNKIVMLVTTFFFGQLLDNDNFIFRYIYPFLAILNIAAIFFLTKIKFIEDVVIIKTNFVTAIKSSLARMREILKNNKSFRDFQTGFLFYGLAWLSTMAVISIFLKKELDLNYSSMSFYKNSYNIIAIILLPYFGQLIGKIDPRRFAVFTFSMLGVFLFFILLTEYYHDYFMLFNIKIYFTLILAYLGYGIFAASMELLWAIGSTYFGDNSQAGNYHSIHITMTGFRGSFAPILGIIFLKFFSYTGVFLIGIFFICIAVSIMIYSQKKSKFNN